jgi:hypothetical protein
MNCLILRRRPVCKSAMVEINELLSGMENYKISNPWRMEANLNRNVIYLFSFTTILSSSCRTFN